MSQAAVEGVTVPEPAESCERLGMYWMDDSHVSFSTYYRQNTYGSGVRHRLKEVIDLTHYLKEIK